MKTAVILQSNYLPWKGYFDLIHDADVFVFYDDVQYTPRDWRNRNKIKTAKGLIWLTIPVGSHRNRLIWEVDIPTSAWQAKHWQSIRQNYSKCPYFNLYQEFFETVYLTRRWLNLSELNQYLIRTIAYEFLGIHTEFRDAREFQATAKKQERLLQILGRLGANRYISGPAAKTYIDPNRFDAAGIELVWKDYLGYPEYPQRFPPFEHGVSILDLLFNVGPDAPWYIWGWREGLPRPKAQR